MQEGIHNKGNKKHEYDVYVPEVLKRKGETPQGMHLNKKDPDYENEYNVLIIYLLFSTEGRWLCTTKYNYNNNND